MKSESWTQSRASVSRKIPFRDNFGTVRFYLSPSTAGNLKSIRIMPTLEKRGEHWRVKIRRKELPNQTRSFNTKAQAPRWARDMDRGFFVDRT
jgi:hypothetical protein